MEEMDEDTDLAIALQLEENFNSEKCKLDTCRMKDVRPAAASLIDTTWEYIDPTPDIHSMFQLFNNRYFWGRLCGVEVKWSKRMTSCAGMCCYEGRGGLCSVRLSAPLLKLRPRKDLVETLLHEMIHAYLFVTNNNRDRDGHGPQFHQHMNRINKEAGTKITVYHSFHEEVKFYQQHWWRCNGPCHKRPPFFGTVRRASNRAPGPNDLWWDQHEATCGGTFIKIKEPQGFKSKARVSAATKPGCSDELRKVPDIRSFFPTRSDSNGAGKDRHQAPSKNNVVGLNDLGTGEGKKMGSFAGMLSNKGAGTLVVTSKKKKQTSVTSDSKNNFVPFGGKGNVLGGSVKRPSESAVDVADERVSPSKKMKQKSEVVQCPVCSTVLDLCDINNHLDTCVKPDTENSSVHCLVCNQQVSKVQLEQHLEACVVCVFDDGDSDDEAASTDRVFPCPCCMSWVSSHQMNHHLDECLSSKLLADFSTQCDS